MVHDDLPVVDPTPGAREEEPHGARADESGAIRSDEPGGAAEQAATAEGTGAETAAGHQPQLPPPPPCPNGFIYTVQPGDTLFLIAQRFGVSLQALIQANPQIPDPNTIFPGQRICVPTGVVVPPPPPACPGGFIYRVQPGDTLFFIAQRFGVTLQALIQANPQIPDPNVLVPGQLICVPTIPTAPPPPPPPCPNGVLYMVAPGDTLFLIAQAFGVTLQALIAANPQIPDPNLIVPGQLICVPTGGPAPQVPTVECCMLLFRTANVPRGPEAGGVTRIFQSAAVGANALIATIDLPAPSTFGGATFVAWLRGVAPDGRTVKVPLVRTNPLLTPRVWAGSLALPAGRQLAPFNDLIVTAEISADVMTPSLNRIVLIGLFAQCQPQFAGGPWVGGKGKAGDLAGAGGSGCCS